MRFFKTWLFKQKFSSWQCPEIVHKFDEEVTLACYHLTLSPTTISLLQGTFARHANSELLPTDGSRHILT